ncbi:MAG: hypothetical protein LBJ47_04100, partial [Tannerella sp.]|nr:hypothetical protein [Tannerella sp.]
MRYITVPVVPVQNSNLFSYAELSAATPANRSFDITPSYYAGRHFGCRKGSSCYVGRFFSGRKESSYYVGRRFSGCEGSSYVVGRPP